MGGSTRGKPVGMCDGGNSHGCSLWWQGGPRERPENARSPARAIPEVSLMVRESPCLSCLSILDLAYGLFVFRACLFRAFFFSMLIDAYCTYLAYFG
jgi:hypothetical protein